MGSKHTPGPWNVYRKSDAAPNDLPWVAATGNRVLAFVAYESILKDDLARADANARLIAAAPDLLETLKLFVSEYVELVESGDAGFWDAETEEKVKQARAAIAKAEGRS